MTAKAVPLLFQSTFVHSVTSHETITSEMREEIDFCGFSRYTDGLQMLYFHHPKLWEEYFPPPPSHLHLQQDEKTTKRNW